MRLIKKIYKNSKKGIAILFCACYTLLYELAELTLLIIWKRGFIKWSRVSIPITRPPLSSVLVAQNMLPNPLRITSRSIFALNAIRSLPASRNLLILADALINSKKDTISDCKWLLSADKVAKSVFHPLSLLLGGIFLNRAERLLYNRFKLKGKVYYVCKK